MNVFLGADDGRQSRAETRVRKIFLETDDVRQSWVEARVRKACFGTDGPTGVGDHETHVTETFCENAASVYNKHANRLKNKICSITRR